MYNEQLKHPVLKIAIILAVISMPSVPAEAALTLLGDGDRKLELAGDFRLRLEEDWDSRSGNGTERDDRLRIRARARLRLNAQLNKYWSAVVGIRTGNNDSQQSPHITLYDFDDNPTGPADINFDLWYAKFEAGGWSGWFGRNNINLWKQDDLTETDDITALGMGLSYAHSLGSGQLTWKGGLVALPAGMRDTSGQALTGEIVYDWSHEQTGFTGGLIYFGINAEPNNKVGAELLLTENNIRNYQTVMLQLQYRRMAYGRPIKLGADFGRNLEDYSREPINSFSEYHQDDVDLAVVFAKYGSNAPGKWLFGYFYAYVEALAVSSSYAQDDWLRWGNVNQTRATNFKGSEFRLAYGIANNMDVVTRLYLVEAIDLLEFDDIAKEDGKRMRIDFNIRF
ncbi:MAG: hypothetical protein P8R04_00400 [Gammaproteobacteria bacterium]|nr:hypothetical protein [Gammaproteobacteria bacterium]